MGENYLQEQQQIEGLVQCGVGAGHCPPGTGEGSSMERRVGEINGKGLAGWLVA